MIKKSDLILSIGILIAAIAVFVVNSAFEEPGAEVKVVSGRDVHGYYSLLDDQEIRIETGAGLNVLTVSGGIAKMTEANCHGGDCLAQQPISATGQQIVCLPNRVLVTIEEAAWQDK